MNGKRTEACGRCSMSTVVDVAAENERGDESPASDPFAGGHIEVDEAAIRAVSPSAWLGRVTRRVDEVATKLTYGK